MNTQAPSLFKPLVLALITLALFSVPFAHRAGAAPITPQLTDVLAMGGTLSDICGERGLHAAGGCEACRIVQAMALPDTPWSVMVERRARALDPGPGGTDAAPAPFAQIKPPVRAPPRG